MAEVPAASTACQPARRHRRSHPRAAEAAFAGCANALDLQLAHRPENRATLDFDSTGVEAYGRSKPGAALNYRGQLSYQPLLSSWSQRGRLLASELLAGNDSTRGDEPLPLLRRSLSYLPDGHGRSTPALTRASTASTYSTTAGGRECASRSPDRRGVRGRSGSWITRFG